MELRRGRAWRMALAAVLAGALLTTGAPAAGDLPEAAEARGRRAVALLQDFVRIPSRSDHTEGVKEAAAWLEGAFGALGFSTRRIQPEGAPNPLVFAELAASSPGASGPAPTVLFYMHYDTQPTGTAADWGSTGGDPFSPKLLSRRWDEPGASELPLEALAGPAWQSARLYGRGVADDKAPIVMHLIALEQYARRAVRPLHLKFLLDGEEEAGSEHMGEALQGNAALLAADLVVLCDGPMDALGRPSVYLGTRGDMHARLTVRTAALSAHSGNYSLLPNAAFRLAAILSTMKDRQGRPTVEGIEIGVEPPTAEERRAMARASEAEAVISKELGVPAFDGDPSLPYYERLLFHPGLIINHLASGRPGNQIPVVAEALLEVRLVTRQEPRDVFEALRRHVARQDPAATLELLDGVAAARMDPADPVIAWGIAAARGAMGEDLLVYPSLGGTLPLLQDFAKAGHRFIGLPLVNYDNNQHVANENLRVDVLARGIEILTSLYGRLGESAPPRAGSTRRSSG